MVQMQEPRVNPQHMVPKHQWVKPPASWELPLSIARCHSPYPPAHTHTHTHPLKIIRFQQAILPQSLGKSSSLLLVSGNW